MLDVAALQRELDAGVSPDLTEDVAPALSRLPLQDAIEFGSGRTDKSIDQRLAFIEALLEAGASVDATAASLLVAEELLYTSPCPRRIAVYIPPTSSSSSTGSCKRVPM